MPIYAPSRRRMKALEPPPSPEGLSAKSTSTAPRPVSLRDKNFSTGEMSLPDTLKLRFAMESIEIEERPRRSVARMTPSTVSIWHNSGFWVSSSETKPLAMLKAWAKVAGAIVP